MMTETPIAGPYAHAPVSIQRSMGLVMLALTPATLFGLYQFGWPAVTLFLVTVTAALAFEAGAQAVMVFDTWGGILAPRRYLEFSLEYMARIVDGLTRERDGQHAIAVNDQWRICFRFADGDAHDVEITDYH
jgi:hypothetical protein